jgi:hypothetical protein
MFEFSVGEKEIHKVKFTFSKFSGSSKVFIDDNLHREFGSAYSVCPIAFELGTTEKHFVFIQIFSRPTFFNFTPNIDVFIDNKFLGNFNLK